MHEKKVVTAGKLPAEAEKALIMLHGRGGSAKDILSLANHLDVAGFALLAPQATGHTWYPYSFMATPAQNEPWLSSALTMLEELVADVVAKGIPLENIYFAGFSQGACLTLEFVTRYANRYGGVVAFTGGLIGDRLYPENYAGDFKQTPVFIGSSDPDPHVPVTRVNESAAILEKMNANITVKIWPGMGHTITSEEISLANQLVLAR